MERVKKIILAIFCLLLVAPANFAFALEINWPSIPGIGSLSDLKEKIPEEQVFGYYIKYFVTLAFYIAAGVALLTIITGGILYIAFSAKPSNVIKGREYMRRGLLGLGIVVTAFLFLYAINPNILIFNLNYQRVNYGTNKSVTELEPSNFTALEVPLGILIGATLDQLEETEKAPNLLIALSGSNPLALAVSNHQYANILSQLGLAGIAQAAPEGAAMPTLPTFETPFFQAQLLTGQLFDEIQALNDIFSCCSCGKTKLHYGFEMKLEGAECQCLPGEEDITAVAESLKKCLDTAGDQAAKDACYAKYSSCSNECTNCSCRADLCDTGDNERTKIAHDAIDGKSQADIEVDVFKPRKEKIMKIVAALEAIKTQATNNQQILFDRAVELQKAGYIVFRGKDMLNEAEFEALVERQKGKSSLFSYLKEKNLLFNEKNSIVLASYIAQDATDDELILYKRWLYSQWKILKEEIGIDDPNKYSTFLYPLKDELGLYPTLDILFNQNVKAEADEISMFLAVSMMDMDEFEALIAQCLSKAMGSAGLGDLLDAAQIKSIASNAVKNGLIKNISQGLLMNGYEISAAVKAEMGKITKEQLLVKCQKECIAECKSTEKSKENKICPQDNPESCDTASADCCARECQKLPVNYLSTKLTEFLSKDIIALLPDELEKALQGTVENFMVSQYDQTNFLDKSLLQLLERGMGQIAQQTLAQQMPNIMEFLSQNLVKTLSEPASQYLSSIDDFLKKYTTDFKKTANEWTENYIQEKVNKLTAWIADVTGATEHQNQVLRTLQDRDGFKVSDWLDQYWGHNGIVSKEQFVENCIDQFNGGTMADETSLPLTLSGVDLKNACENDYWNIYKDEVADEKSRAILESLSDFGTWGGMMKDVGRDLADVTVEGFKALPGQMLIALIQASSQMAFKYISAYVEDKVFTRFYPELLKAEDIRNNFSKFMDLTVSDILPDMFKNILQRTLTQNLNAFLQKTCAASTGSTAPCESPDTIIPDGDESACVTVNYNTSSDNPLSLSIEVPKSAADKACAFSQNLNEPIKQKLPDSVQEILDSKVKTLIPGGEALDKSLAEFFFDGANLPNVAKAISTSVKDLVCGNFSLNINEPSFWEKKCQNTLQDGNISIEKARARGLTETERAACSLMNDLCKRSIASQFPYILERLNDVIEQYVDKECSYVWSTTCNNDRTCQACPSSAKDACSACNIFKTNSILYSILYGAIREMDDDLGMISGPAEEIAFYQWFYAVFAGTSGIGDVDAVIAKREIDWQKKGQSILERWQGGAKQEITNILTSPSRTSPILLNDAALENINHTAQKLINHFMANKPLGLLLTESPLGVVKPLEYNGASLLRDAGQGKSFNFLNETPYSLLGEVCSKVNREWDKINPDIPGNPQSPYNELSDEELDFYAAAQTACGLLTKTPGAVWGIDKKLVEYMGDYRGMVDILQPPYIQNDEMPPKLYSFLQFLRNKTAVDAIRKIGQETGDHNLIVVADFLDKGSFAVKIANAKPDFFKTKIVNYLFIKACDEMSPNNQTAANDCVKVLGKDLSQILGVESQKKIFDKFMKDYLTRDPLTVLMQAKFFDQSLAKIFGLTDEQVTALKTPLIDYLASMEDYKYALTTPLIDIIGRMLGWDLFLNDFLEDQWGGVDDFVNDAVAGSRSVVQSAMDDVIVDAPNAIFDAVAAAFDSQAAERFNDRLFMNVTAGCVQMAPDVQASCKAASDSAIPKFYDEENQQCCDMASMLVCEDKNNNQCIKCRVLSDPDADSSDCGTGETFDKSEIGNDGKPIPMCCRNTQDVTRDDGDKCCQTVMECIAEKVSEMVYSRLLEMSENGVPAPSVIFGNE